MSNITDFLVILVTAVVLQNAVFTRGLGSSKHTIMMSSRRKTVIFGLALTAVSTLSSILAWPINYLLMKYIHRTSIYIYLRYSSVLVSVCIVYVAVYLISRRYLPKTHYYVREILVYSAFNCSVLGSLLIAFSNNYHFFKTVGFAFGSGIGYMLAIMLIYEGKRTIHLSDIPAAFRGMPIVLLYIGLLSLAFYGLIGYQLPT